MSSKKGKIIKCSVCQKEFYRTPTWAITSKFCSRDCAYKGLIKGKKRNCNICGKEYYRSPSQVKLRGSNYCSQECKYKGTSRKTKGKIRSELWTLRRADKVFSNFIRERDDWTCQLCDGWHGEGSGQRRNLHCSHFWGRARKSTRFDPDNCIAACYSCHYWKLEKEKQGRYRDLMLKRLGKERYNQLEIKAYTIKSQRESILEFMEFCKTNLTAQRVLSN